MKMPTGLSVLLHYGTKAPDRKRPMTKPLAQSSLLAATPDAAMAEVTARYAVAITPEVREIIAQDPGGAVARQYQPDVREIVETPDELEDPIGDDRHSPVPGIVHRYADRVLLKPVHVCAVYCRFCFRREKVGPGSEMLKSDDLDRALDYIRNAPKVWEVILTGGDPLVLSPRRLQEIVTALSAIDHVKIIRLHTRVPVANPRRVTDELIAALDSPKAVYAVLHCNHASELTEAVQAAAQRFIRAGIPLLSQSTLLAGINDNPDTLDALYRRLTEMKIKPYYLHHPDKAPGTGHFRLSLRRGQEIVQALWGRLSGIARPSYMLDIPGGHGKVSALPAAIAETADGAYDVRDPKGQIHTYRDSQS